MPKGRIVANKTTVLQTPLEAVTESIRQQKFELPPLPEMEDVAVDAPAEQQEQPQSPAAKSPSAPATGKKKASAGFDDDYTPPAELRPLFEAAARKYNVPVNVLMALGHQESRYKPTAVGKIPTEWGRAKGIMQYIDPTARSLGINPFDPEQAVGAAARQLRERLDNGYSMEDAVKEHFAGTNRARWGKNTAAYGREVLGKAKRIAEMLYPFDQSPEEVARRDRQRTEIATAEQYRKGVPQEDNLDTALAAQQKASEENSGVLSDIGRNLKIGLNTAAQDVRELVGKVPGVGQPIVKGLDAVDEYFTGKKSDELLRSDNQAMTQAMSPQMEAALQKKWWDSDKGTFGPAWTDWRSYAGGVVQSLPEQVLTMGPAMRLAKWAYGAKIAAGASAEAAAAAASRAATIAGGVSEGALGGAQSSRAVRDEVLALKDDVLNQSEAYQALIASGMSPQQAKSTLADDLATRAFVTSGVATGLFGGMGDRVIAKIITDKVGGSLVKNIVRNTAKGVVGEGVLEELPQSVLQQLSQNEAIKQADPKKSLSDDVVNQGLGGLVLGGLQGGGMAAAASGLQGRREDPAQPAAAQQQQPSYDMPPEGSAFEEAAPGASTAPAMANDAAAANPVQPLDPAVEGDWIPAGDYLPPGQQSTAAGPMTRALENTAIQQQQDTAAPTGPLTKALENTAAQTQNDAQPAQSTEAEQPNLNVGENAAQTAETPANAASQTLAALPTEAVSTPVTEQPAAKPVSLEDMAEPELRARLKYLAGQAKASGGWNKMLMDERRKVERQIDKLAASQEPAKQEPVAEQAPAPETKPAPVAVEQGKDEYAGKWFGSQEKADAFIAKKKAGATHEVVQTGKVRWEIKPKQADAKPELKDGAKVGVSFTSPDRIEPATVIGQPYNDQSRGEAVQVALEGGGSVIVSANRITAAPNKQQPTSRVVRVYKTKSGKIGATIKEQTSADGGVRYAYTGEWGAGSGKDAENMQAIERMWQQDKRGFTVTDADGNEIMRGQEEQPTPAKSSMPAMPYANPTNPEEVWSGRGRKPQWVADYMDNGGRLEDLRVESQQPAANPNPSESQAVNDFIEGRRDTPPTVAEVQAEAKPTEPTTPTGGKKGQFANNKIFTADKVEAARARLKSKLNQLNSGIDPELLVDGMTIAGAYIEAGVRNFRDYAKAMTEDFGESIKPYLLSFYEAARNYPGLDTDGMTPVGAAKVMHSELMKDADISEAKEAIGETAEKPAKRTKKTGAKADMTLTQDWGVDHIDGWEELKGGANEPTDYGLRGGVKDAFLKEARAYLNTVAGILTEQGYAPHTDSKGRPEKPVSVNESGVATSGDVSLTLVNPETGSGIYVHIGDTSLRGVVPTTQSGIAIMFRAASADNKFGTGMGSGNRWAPTDLSAADFAIMLDKEAKQYADRKAAAANKENKQNDTQGTETGAGAGAEGQAAGAVRGAESQQPAGRGAEPDTRPSRGVDSGSQAAGNRSGDDAGQARVRGRSDGADANAEPAVQGSREPSPAAGRRGSDEPSSGVRNYRIQPGELKREGSWKATAQRNVEIIELAKKITAEGRQATPEERAQLVKYTGWGASEVANGIFPNQYGQYKDASWRDLGERLKAALTEEEYAQARRTTQYAHYTSEGVIRSIYAGLQRLGVAGGSILEPGMGVGHFNGLMPDGMAANSRYTGIEYDTITGTIGKLLYPESNIIVGDYTRTNMPKDFFDAAVGNPPFSSTQILTDPEYKSRRPMLHDYFFMKTIDRVKPGGVLVFVTSKGTMDKGSDKSRKYLAERANLLGAIRLPQTAFKDNAGTEVVTDVIFLQKRGQGIADNGVQWLGTKEVQTPQGPTSINEYFADHPEMVLGQHALAGSMYRANEYTVLPPQGDIDELFAKAVQTLPENVYRPERGTPAERALVQERDFNPKSKKEGGLYLSDDGKLMQVENGSGVAVEFRTNAEGKQIALTPKQKKWLRSYVGLRDALKQAQYDQLNDGNWQKSLKELNKVYDAFVKEHGPILDYTTIERTAPDGTVTETKRYKNEPLLRMDAEGALAYALETVKEDGSIAKGAVLNGRVLDTPRAPEIKTTQDALFVSLNRNGKLDIDDVAAMAGTDKDSVIRDLGTAIYDAPGTGWQLADEYLSGNVVRKLKEARAAAELDPRYKRNVEALLAAQPRPLGPTDITVRLGANWVPASDIETFASEVLGENMGVTYSPLLNKWDVDQKSRSLTEWGFDKMSSGQILDGVLNNRQLKVTFRDQDNKTHVDLEATEKANDIAKKMRERFSSWLWTDPKRAERLVSYYNENFNNIAPRKFDGSHLTLPGVSALIQLRPHQKRAVWRVVQQGDSYLAHAVGAGKTMEMIAAGMEERRLGLVNKPMYVVPNHMLAQFSREFLELYPAANIMVADEQNFHTHNRKRFVAQAALNNPDAIVITHSAFGRIGMSDEFYTDFMQRQIDDWKAELEDADSSDRVTVKQIERRIEQLEQRMEGRQNRDKKDQVLTFEELGVDKLYVDEFHEFRKLDFATNQGNVKGVDPNGSQRALDLFMKVEYLRSKKPGRALVAASGTPVTNTMGELYTAQRFFQPEQMKEDGLESFDAWANQYGDIVTGFEQNAAGGYDMVARFAKFQNVPELMRRVRSFMDILTSSNLGELVQRPDVVGGGRKVEVTPSPEGYKEFQQTLQKRIEAIKRRKGPPVKGQDIILNVIGDGRFSAIDMRFVDPTLPSDPNSKLNQMIDDLIAAYKETANWEYTAKDGKVEPNKGSTLMLFTDIGLGEQSAASRGFDMRGWIEKRLTDAGIPREHIAFMRDFKQHAKKERMFADMREGKKRILIGGKEMETGTNVQKRLSHLFHLDAPWFPASVEQREGRAVRQGNQNKQVVLKAYATKGSYDSTMWGMNARKARFIEQAMNGDDSVRSLDDVSEASAFEMAAALASGDERYMKLAGIKADVERLVRLRQSHYDDQNRLMREKHWAEEQIKRNTARVQELDKAIAKRQPIKAGEFTGKVGKTTYDSREEFSQALFQEFQTLAGEGLQDEKVIGEIGGFPIKFYGLEMKGSGTYAASLHVDLPGDPDPLLAFPLDPDTAVSGIATRAANQVNGMDKERAQAQGYIDSAKAKAEQASKRLGAPFPEEALLLDKVAELNGLEAELAAESKENNADAAAATVEVEGTTEQADTAADGEPRYSVNADGEVVGEFGPVSEEFRDDPDGAIQWLQENKTGEAIIDHPVLGEISLIWGNGKMGLSHIAARRGEDFLSRIAAILKETDVYEKPTQTGRVFLGNESYEATIRLDWNGQPKAWLVSAYEKYGDAKQSTQPEQSNRSEVVRKRGGRMNVDELRAEITTGVIGQVIARLIDNGQIVLHQNAETLPKAARGKRGVQAVTLANGQIHLVANRLGRDNARPVLLHEMFHMGGEKLVGSKEWGNLMGRLGSLYRQAELSTGKAREFFDRARDRVAAARQQGAVSTGMTIEEFGAYAIEEWEQKRDSLPAVIRKWVEDFIGQIKAYVLTKFGKQFGTVTPAQLAGMAKMVIMNAAVLAERGQLSGISGKFSVSSGQSSGSRVTNARETVEKNQDAYADAKAAQGAEFNRFTGIVDQAGRNVIKGINALRTTWGLVSDNEKAIPSIRDAYDLEGKMDGRRIGIATEASKAFGRDFSEMAIKDPAAADKLADLMTQATLWQIRPDKPKNDRWRQAWKDKYDELRAAWDALPQEAKDLYDATQKFYEDRSKDIHNALKERIMALEIGEKQKRDMLAELQERFDRELGTGPYFPLARFGSYLVVGVKGEGEDQQRVVMNAEYAPEAEAMAAELRRRGYTVSTKLAKEQQQEQDMRQSSQLVRKIAEMIEGQVPDFIANPMLDELNQIFLDALPLASARKSFIHRKNVAGFSRDMARALNQSAVKLAGQIAKLEYAQKIEDAFAKAEKQAEASPDNYDLQPVVGEMRKRFESTMRFKTNPVAAALQKAGFAFTLAYNLSSAAVNLLQMTIAGGQMGARHGALKANAQIAKALREIGATAKQRDKDAHIFDLRKSGRPLNPGEKKMLESLEQSGKIDVTAAMDAYRAAHEDTKRIANSKVGRVTQKIMDGMGMFMQAAEVINRQAVALAAYRMELQKNGGDIDAAIKYAAEVLDDTQFNMNISNQPRFMHNNAARVVMQYKGFAINMMDYLGRTMRTAMDGMDKGERRQATKALGLIFATQVALAGIGSLPLYMGATAAGAKAGKVAAKAVGGGLGAQRLATVLGGGLGALALAAFLNGAFGDDDEPWDWKADMRRWLAEHTNATLAQFLDRGLFSIAGVDIADRISMNGLVMRDLQDQYGKKAWQNMAEEAALSMGGVALSKFYLGGARALDAMEQGNTKDAFMAMLPTALSNMLKGTDLAANGMTDKRTGTKLMDVNAAEAMVQMFGFQPSAVRERRWADNVAYNADKQMQDRKSRLLDAIAKAQLANDSKAEEAAWEAADRWSDKNSDLYNAITQKDVRNRVRQLEDQRSMAEGESRTKGQRRQLERQEIFKRGLGG